ncbi:glycosyl hydrolase family 18 protein [Streptomyces sp. NPDC052101]|uniref:glycosyl hydrolase family 18 protein n=1 Tax=Streptomyces sp. NPDC052101 TaxID=3155763 RepID=UPI0034384902
MSRATGRSQVGTVHYHGYYPQWAIYARNFFLRDLHANGTADRLTILNYAFANISSDTQIHPGYKAFAATAPNKNPGHADGGKDVGDADADWVRPFQAAESVDGTADPGWNSPNYLKGNFNQLKKLKAKHPKLKVLISFGGWTYSRNFSKAATDAHREEFVKSCIDLYIRGNLPTKIWTDTQNFPAQWRAVYGGAGVAAGIFDGIDIDWEWPGTDKGLPGNLYSKDDKKNLPLLLKEFRKQLDALPARPDGEKYLLTAFLPADPSVIEAGWDVPEVMKYLDYGNLQGYDLHGAFECPASCITNHQSALHPINGDPTSGKLSVETAVDAWVKAGAPKNKIVLGIPFYGRGWEGVQSDAKGGLFQQAKGAVPTPKAKYEAGVNEYRDLAGLVSSGYTLHRDDANAVAWLHSPTERIFWTFDDPTAVYKKAQFAKSKGLAGAMSYSLDGDEKTTGILSKYIRAALDGQEPPEKEQQKNACTAPAWNAKYVYVAPNEVTYEDAMWQSTQWSKGTPPGTKNNDGNPVWKKLKACTLPIRLKLPAGAKPWDNSVAYKTGNYVTYEGQLYSAAWDVPAGQKDKPGGNPDTWQPLGTYEK